MTIKYDGEDDGFAGKRQPIAMDEPTMTINKEKIMTPDDFLCERLREQAKQQRRHGMFVTISTAVICVIIAVAATLIVIGLRE